MLLLLLILPVAASASISLGIAPFSSGLSVWYATDKTWIGAELDVLSLKWNEESIPPRLFEHAANDPPPFEAVDHVQRHLRYAAVVQRNFRANHKTAPFIYGRLYIGLVHDEYTGYILNNWNYAGPELGLGIVWRPMKWLSIAARQGLAWQEDTRRPSFDTVAYTDAGDSTTTTIRLNRPRVLVLYSF